MMRQSIALRALRAGFFLLLGLLRSTDARAEDIQDLIGGPTLGDMVKEAMDSAAEFRAAKASITATFAAARKQFWSTYPDKAGHAAAKAKFEELLLAKDYHFVSATGQGMAGADVLTGGAIDGGIHPSARREFRDWSDVFWIKAKMAARSESTGNERRESFLDTVERMASLFSRETMSKAFADSAHNYAAYKLARDIAEFDAAGQSFPGKGDPEQFVIHLYVRDQRANRNSMPERTVDPWKSARSTFADMTNVLGADHVLAVASVVMKAPRGADGRIPPGGCGNLEKEIPGGLRDRTPLGVFEGLLGTGNARAYFLSAILNPWTLTKSDPYPSKTYWERRKGILDDLARQHGEAKVLSLVERYRTLPEAVRTNTNLYFDLTGCSERTHSRHTRTLDCIRFVLDEGKSPGSTLDGQNISQPPDGSKEGSPSSVPRPQVEPRRRRNR